MAALGIIWLHEGLFKCSAHFGRADIPLVDGAKSNSRVPDYFAAFADSVLRGWPGLFGFVIPLLETGFNSSKGSSHVRHEVAHSE